MKRIFYIIILFFFLNINAQVLKRASVEKTTYGLQTGILGIWGNSENKLTNSIALRSELGFDSGVFGGNLYDKVGFILAPVLTIEPRYYYNLNKAISKSKDILNNSGNFISLKTSYHPAWFVISNFDNIKAISDISIIPTWGIRRNISKHFNYEAGIGIGYQHILSQGLLLKEKKKGILNLHLRIGYVF